MAGVRCRSAVAAVLPVSERLGGDRATFWAGLGGPSWIDQPDVDTGAFSLVSDMLEELGPRGVVDGLGEHPAGQADDIELLHRDVREAIDEPQRQLVRKVPTSPEGDTPQSEDMMDEGRLP